MKIPDFIDSNSVSYQSHHTIGVCIYCKSKMRKREWIGHTSRCRMQSSNLQERLEHICRKLVRYYLKSELPNIN